MNTIVTRPARRTSNPCDLPRDPLAPTRWLPRSGSERPISEAGPRAARWLGAVPAEEEAETLAAVAARWFHGSDASRAERVAFVLHAAGSSDDVIATVLGVSRRTARNLIDQARRALVRRARDLAGVSRERAALTLWLADEPLPLIALVLGMAHGSVEAALGRLVREALGDRGSRGALARRCWAETTRVSGPRRIAIIG